MTTVRNQVYYKTMGFNYSDHMSKAFTKETDSDQEEDLEQPDPVPAGVKNYMTPQGHAALQEELRRLLADSGRQQKTLSERRLTQSFLVLRG